MRIKRLEIHGFKSFADRMVFNFGKGITGVVGPNGCGKSNVVDAIRWCMGEMSAKHLRGRAMQDVIFSGSDSRGPSGMAEVTLTFDNDGDAPPQYASFAEISVTRRLHRDGTSEYLVNKAPARLRDITDLFLGTGVGTRAYSIIEQGRIGFVVNSRPEERRSLIEEVAGITKFKVRKKAAERRLEATEQNLARVTDIISELERQLGSLRRQARKAERYRELKAELRDLDLHAATVEHLRLDAIEKMQGAEQRKLETQLEDAHGGLAATEAKVEAERLRLSGEEETLRREQELSAKADAELAALERDLTHWRNQIAEAKARRETAEEDYESSRDRLGQVEAESEQLVEEREAWAAHAESGESEIESLAARVREVQALVTDMERDLEARRKDGLEVVHQETQAKTWLGNVARMRQDLSQSLSRGRTELEAQRQEQETAHEQATRLTERQRVLGEELAQWQERLTALRAELVTQGKSCDALAETVGAAKDELGRRRSRLASLQEIAQRMEGYSDGVRHLLRGGADEAPVLDGLAGVVADVLSSPAEYEVAVEALLGERLQYLLVHSRATATSAIELLRAENRGRGGFVAPGTRATDPAALSGEGVLGAVPQLVTVREDFAAQVAPLLERAWVVRDLAAAEALWPSLPQGGRLVTLQGDVVTHQGLLTGGAGEGAGLLAAQREIRELTDVVAECELALQSAVDSHRAAQERQLQLDVDVQQLEKEIQAARVEKAGVDKELSGLEATRRRLTERIEVLTYEVSQRHDELTTLEREEAEVVARAEQATREREAIDTALADMQERRRLRGAELDRLTAELGDQRVRVTSQKERLSSADATLQRLATTRKELQARMDKDRATAEESAITITTLEEQVHAAASTASEKALLAEQRRQDLNLARARYDEERQRTTELEQSLKEKRHGIEMVQEALLGVRMDLQKLALDRQKLLEQVSERHDVSLLAVITDFHLRPLPSDADRQRRAELDKSIKNIGPINLLAIDECEEVEKRFAFLSRQRDDLVEALETLRRAIARINKASRERFREAFDAVNEMFQQVFPRLFRGGEARLILTDADDVLEAGVDIVAMPPGKKPQSVSLLSGGEKALTATSLVFSIFLIKPSPFCILDEVDAPLDDANVGRFCEMLREISAFSQFIVITHDKQTMQQSDRLYGVTMEEPGMSKVVSVDLDRPEEQEEVAA